MAVLKQNRAGGKAGRILRICLAVLLAVAILALCPATQDTTGPIKAFILCTGACGLALAWMGLSWLGKLPVRRPGMFFWPFVALLAWELFTALHASHVGPAWVEVRRMAVLALLYFLTAQLFRTPRQARMLLAMLCAAMSISTLYAFGQRLGIDPFSWAYADPAMRHDMPGTLGNPNYAAHALGPCLLFVAWLASRQGARWWALLAIPFAAHLFLTGQRGALAALAAALALLAGVVWARWRKWTPETAPVRVLALTMISLLACASLCIAVLWMRAGSILTVDESLLVRLNGYSGAVQMLKEHPVFGVGPGNYVIANPPYWTPLEQRRFAELHTMNAHVHCEPLEFAVDGGVLAGAIYCFLLLLGITNGISIACVEQRSFRRGFALLCAAFFCLFAVDGCFGFNLRVPISAALFFVLAGLFDGVCMRPASFMRTKRFRVGQITWRAGAALILSWLVLADARVFLAHVRHAQGLQAKALGFEQEAQTSFARAEHLAPWQWTYPAEQGALGLASGRYGEAASHFERALTQNPSYLFALTSLAEAQLMQAISAQHMPEQDAARTQLLEQALENANCAQRLCALVPETFALKGRILAALADEKIREGKSQEAAQVFQEADACIESAIAQGAPGIGRLYGLLIRLRLLQGSLERAETAAAGGTQANPENDALWAYRLEIARRTGRYAGVEEALHYRLAVMPEDVHARLALARLRAQQGQTEQAVIEYDALAILPGASTEYKATAKRESDELKDGLSQEVRHAE